MPLLEEFLGCTASWSQSFLVSKFQSLSFKFQSFDNTKFEIPKNQDVWDTHFQHFHKNANLKIPTTFLNMSWDLFLDYLEFPVSPKINKICSGAQGHVRKCQNHRSGGLGFSYKQNEKL